MRRRFVSVCCLSGALALCLAARGAGAGTIILSGDVTPVFLLSSSDPGNQQFFRNLLGAGSGVAVQASENVPGASASLAGFYDSLPGVSVSELSDLLTAASLQGVDLLLLPFPDNAFAASELTAVGSFLDAGGTLFITGESSSTLGNPSDNASVNALLASLGSGLSLVNETLDLGARTATGDRIVADALTAGVEAFAYGSTSRVSGGRPLFLTSEGASFVAYVPEPASAWLLAGGLAALARHRRRRP